MNKLWTLFVTGLFGMAVLSAMLNDTRASDGTSASVAGSATGDPRLKKISDTSLSGLKTPVPSVVDAEAAIVSREKELKEREARLNEAQERLGVEEARLKVKVDELEKLQADTRAIEERNRVQNDAILKKMVKTFETMAPKKAAGVLATTKDDLAVEVLLTMKEKKLAAIMDAMDPARATALSAVMSKRRPRGPASKNAGADDGASNNAENNQGTGPAGARP